MLWHDGRHWYADEGPQAADVARLLTGEKPKLRGDRIPAIRVELDQRAWDGGHLVRTAQSAGLPVPRGVAGLHASAARAWVRAILASLDGADVAAACRAEPVVQFQPADGRPARRVEVLEAKEAAASEVPKTRDPTAEDLRQALAIRWPGFPEPAPPEARQAVKRWEEATGQRFPWPDPFEHPGPVTGPPARVIRLADRAPVPDRALELQRFEEARQRLADALAAHRVGGPHAPQRELAAAASDLLEVLTGAPPTTP